MKTYREMIAWQKSMNLVSEIYKATKNFPRAEIFGLTNQIRRASVSVPSNIAEGFGRRNGKEFKHFLLFAISSLFEVQTQLEISKNLEYLSPQDYKSLFDLTREIEAMPVALIKKIE